MGLTRMLLLSSLTQCGGEGCQAAGEPLSSHRRRESLYTARWLWAPSWAPDTRVGARESVWAPSWAPDTRVGARESDSTQPSLFGTSRRVTKRGLLAALCLEHLGE